MCILPRSPLPPTIVIYSNSIDTFFQCLIGKWLALSASSRGLSVRGITVGERGKRRGERGVAGNQIKPETRYFLVEASEIFSTSVLARCPSQRVDRLNFSDVFTCEAKTHYNNCAKFYIFPSFSFRPLTYTALYALMAY